MLDLNFIGPIPQPTTTLEAHLSMGMFKRFTSEVYESGLKFSKSDSKGRTYWYGSLAEWSALVDTFELRRETLTRGQKIMLTVAVSYLPTYDNAYNQYKGIMESRQAHYLMVARRNATLTVRQPLNRGATPTPRTTP